MRIFLRPCVLACGLVASCFSGTSTPGEGPSGDDAAADGDATTGGDAAPDGPAADSARDASLAADGAEPDAGLASDGAEPDAGLASDGAEPDAKLDAAAGAAADVGTTACTLLPSIVTADAGPTLTEFTLPNPGSLPVHIAKGPDGNLWIAENAGRIARLTPTGCLTEFPVPDLPSNAVGTSGIVAGPDGNMWFGDGSGRIDRITMAGVITEFLDVSQLLIDPDAGGPVNEIPYVGTVGPDNNLWFTARCCTLYRITLSGVATPFPLPPIDDAGRYFNPYMITAGPDGNLWFAEANGGGAVGRMTTGGTVTQFPGYDSVGIVAGPDGNLWFTELRAIGRITPGGTVTEFPLPAADGGRSEGAWGIALGPDQNLWFAESTSDKIGKITPSGTITEYPLPTSGSSPHYLAAGPDGNLWFSEYGIDRIGRLTLP
jgi:streptogramin lyase